MGRVDSRDPVRGVTMAYTIRDRQTGYYLQAGHVRDAIEGAAQTWTASEDCALEFPDTQRAATAREREGISVDRVEVRERTPRQQEPGAPGGQTQPSGGGARGG